MEEFIQHFKRSQESNILFEKDNITVTEIENNTTITETDKIIVLPYIVDSGEILLKYNNIPAYENRNKNIKYYLNCAHGEYDVDIINGVENILLKEFGIKTYMKEHIYISNPIFLTTTQTTQYHFCYVLLYNGKYEQVALSEYDQIQMKDTNASINTSELGNAVIYDLVTKYAIDVLQKEYLLF